MSFRYGFPVRWLDLQVIRRTGLPFEWSAVIWLRAAAWWGDPVEQNSNSFFSRKLVISGWRNGVSVSRRFPISLNRVSFLSFLISNHFLHELDWSLDFIWDFALPSRHGHCTCEVSLYIRKYLNSTSRTLPMSPICAWVLGHCKVDKKFIEFWSGRFHSWRRTGVQGCERKLRKVETGWLQPGTASNQHVFPLQGVIAHTSPHPNRNKIWQESPKGRQSISNSIACLKRTPHDKRGRTSQQLQPQPQPER